MSFRNEVKDYGTIIVNNLSDELSELVNEVENDDDHKKFISLSTVVRYCGAIVCLILMVLSCELRATRIATGIFRTLACYQVSILH